MPLTVEWFEQTETVTYYRLEPDPLYEAIARELG